MKNIAANPYSSLLRRAFLTALALASLNDFKPPARADETCSSPYLARIEGQKEFIYVLTLGVEGLADRADKLVTVDVKPGRGATAR
jgi:methanethiol oxidase